jgi:transcriptional regulator with XRE-family HTH domain
MKKNTKDILRDLRLKKGVSQAEVARYLGIERASYTAYESGVSRPVRHMEKLATYFGVSVDYLLGLTDVPQGRKINLEEKEKILLYSFLKLNEAGKNSLMEYADFLLSQDKYTEKEKVTSA